MGTFPPPALRTRRADFRHRALQWNHAARTRAVRLRPAGGSCEPWHPAHTLALAGRCVVRPVDALTTATARVVPFAYACDDVWHSCSFIGVIGRSATPGACSLSPSLPPEAPSLGRHCPASTCRVGGGAPRGRWPPSAAQTVRAVFPHTAFTKTSSRDEDRWRNQRVEPSSGPSGSASRQVSSVADVGVFHSWNCASTSAPLLISPSCLVPTVFAGRLPQPTGCRPLTVTRLSPRFRYYSAVRLLDEHPFPLRSRL